MYNDNSRFLTTKLRQSKLPILTASDIAKYFLAKTGDTAEADELISHLKLQKLLYYAQGFHLAMTGSPLFADEIQAWQQGPVVPSVWDEYKEYGRRGIDLPLDFDLTIGYTMDTQSILEQVWAVYGQFSAWKLRNMTHEESPWNDTPIPEVISHAKMMRYFKTRLK